MRTRFTFPIVSPTEPLVDDPFFAWMNQNVNRNESASYLYFVGEYLKPMGFTLEDHTIDEQDLKTLEHVCEHWYRTTPHHPPCKFDELFVASPSGAYFLSNKHPQRYDITPKLKKMIEEAGWIYDVSPATTYFEVIGDRLFAKYQQILGSRQLCVIEDWEGGK